MWKAANVKGRMFNLLASVSLMLCVATGVLCVRSFATQELLTMRTDD